MFYLLNPMLFELVMLVSFWVVVNSEFETFFLCISPSFISFLPCESVIIFSLSYSILTRSVLHFDSRVMNVPPSIAELKTYGLAAFLYSAIFGNWESCLAIDWTKVLKFGLVTPNTNVQLSCGYRSQSVKINRHSSLFGYSLLRMMTLNKFSVLN